MFVFFVGDMYFLYMSMLPVFSADVFIVQLYPRALYFVGQN